MKATNYWKIFLILVVFGPQLTNGQSKLSGVWNKITSFFGKYWEVGALAGFVGSIVLSDQITEVIILNLSDKEFTLLDASCDEGIFDIDRTPPVKKYPSTGVTYAVGSNQYFRGVSCQVVYAESNMKTELKLSTDNWYFGGNYGQALEDNTQGIKVEVNVGYGWRNQVKFSVNNKSWWGILSDYVPRIV